MPQITLAEFFERDQWKAINCYTREQSDTVRQAFHNMGKTWSSGAGYLTLDFWEDEAEYRHYTNDGRTGTNHHLDNCVFYEFDDIVEFSSEQMPESDPNQFRVLLRRDYRWHNASWDDKENTLTVDHRSVSQANIIAIENDPRVKYVRCKMCGSIIKNTKKAIEKHAQLAKSSKACLTCQSLYVGNEKNLKESFVQNDDGTYTQTKKSVCALTCGYTYSNPLIDDDNARARCKYRKCSVDTVEPAENFFTKYPGAFDDMATVDAIDMNKWQINCRRLDNWVDFKWKGRYNIILRTTNLGIIDRFVCGYRNDGYEIVYSKKYDKMFMASCGVYEEFTLTNSNVSETYYNELMKIMRNIYEGEN